MADLWIHVFRDAGICAKGAVEQRDKVGIASSAADSDVILLNGTTPIKFVRLAADADCYVEIGGTPTATNASLPIFSGQPEYFEVPVGHKISVLEKV